MCDGYATSGDSLKVEAHENDVNTVCFMDSSGQVMVSGSDDQLVKVWDRRMLGESGAGCVGVLPGHSEGITHVSPKVSINNVKGVISCRVMDGT